MQGDGQAAWLALAQGDAGSLVRLVPDDAGWSVAATSASTAVCVATSFDGDVVATGSPALNRVDIVATGVAAQTLSGDGGFGSSVALSGDGAVLVVGDRDARDSSAQIYARLDDGGYGSQLTLVSPLSILSDLLAFGARVSVSRDGNTVAVGFPNAGCVVIATRTASTWAVSEAALGTLLFGEGVALSSDGKQLGVASPLASTLSVFTRP